MYKLVCTFLICLSVAKAGAQIKYITFGVDYANFSWSWLDNRPNSNSKNSWLNSVGFFKESKGVFSWQVNAQAGKLNNLGKNSFYHQSSNWVKLNTDVLINFYRIFTPKKTTVVPSWLLGYGFNYIFGHKETGYNQVGMNLSTGLHLKYKSNNGMMYTLYNGLGQRLGFDFRTCYVAGVGVGFEM